MSVTTGTDDSLSLTAAGAQAASDLGLPLPFGRYVLLRRLATGGMAEIFLALQRGLSGFEKVVVIKRMLPSITNDHDFLAMLHHEARIAATMSHPNIVPVFEADVQDLQPYLVFEYVPGQTLSDLLARQGAMPAVEAADLMSDVLDALAVAHAAGVAPVDDVRLGLGHVFNHVAQAVN